ncbi:LEA type 2 family protein [Humisphaera borealis]|uniref:LEA type 2 family protein n=1 Tax=Humisphaera borealis TaxID=2807512 RepID=A0A7M2WXI9_9BACT|nr:LEA type 2 family protein [Humisphaera borealis]QOV89521.1 LEA type 2 family protein [Humisphaera borealis]
MSRLAILLFALLSGVGCNSAIPPTIELRSADVDEITTDELELQFNVKVTNPNAFALPVSAATYNLRLGGITVIEGEAKPTVTIPAEGSLPVAIPISIGFERLMMAEQALIESKGNVPYEMVGSLEFSAGPLKSLGQGVRVPLKLSGTLPLRDAVKNPLALLTSPAGRKFVDAVLGKGLGDFLSR